MLVREPVADDDVVHTPGYVAVGCTDRDRVGRVVHDWERCPPCWGCAGAESADAGHLEVEVDVRATVRRGRVDGHVAGCGADRDAVDDLVAVLLAVHHERPDAILDPQALHCGVPDGAVILGA